MRTRLASLLLAMALTAALGAQSADHILSQYAAAMGGDKGLKALTTVAMHGEATNAATGAEASFTLLTAAPDRIYLEYTGLEDAWSEAYNGNSAWRRDGAGGLRTLTGAASDQLKASALLWSSHLVDTRKDKWAAAYSGPATVDGRAAETVTLTNQVGAAADVQRKLYFDAATHLLLEDEQIGPGAGGAAFFGDFRKVGGVPEPYRITLVRGDGPDAQRLDITLDEVTPNAGLAAHVFDYPAPELTDRPDMAQLLADLNHHQASVDKLRRNYSCTLDETDEEIDGGGRLKKTTETEYYVFYLGRREIEKRLATNGAPLSPREQQKEDERIDKEQQEAQKEMEARQRAAVANGSAAAAGTDPAHSPEGGGAVHIRDFLAAMDFYNFRREPYRGQTVLVFDFRPKPGFKPHDLGETIASKLVGTVWIDEHEHEVARLQARNQGAIKFGGGILASLDSGSSVVLEQEKINNEIWLPTLTEVHVAAHVLLLKSEKANEIDRYSDYKKFTATTTLTLLPSGGGH